MVSDFGGLEVVFRNDPSVLHKGEQATDARRNVYAKPVTTQADAIETSCMVLSSRLWLHIIFTQRKTTRF